ncbi:NADH-quinone oxidoreductase subunit L [Brachymonas sp.]|uniref:NADH-quinone oxidoreductase subunit L n=1 Tax=Brachymonas sp. TaxID=1936292 RepID=UPI0035B16EAA
MNSSLSLNMLLIVPLAPLVMSILVGVFGTALGGNILGRKASQILAISGVFISFVVSVLVFKQTLAGATFNQTIYEWMNIGGLKMEVGFMVDNLTAMMMCVVTFVSLMVHIYTVGYMEDDDGYDRFFSYISLFTFSMLMLVMSNNFLQLFFGWEAVGLVSYLLIGFWFKRPTAIFANLKAFLVNRVGDFGFILGIGLILAYTGTFNYTEFFAKVNTLAVQTYPGVGWNVATMAAICLFIGAMGKSAQFPLHIWLPDSMEGPTPISALIHAATMVTAGIFMVTRMSPLYELSDTALNFVLVIGAITAFFMGLLGIIQNDIKRVVAYSTLSQLGYMTMALGVSAYPVAVFHLMTHAFFKALLFLGAGSVIMGVHHNQDMRWMGGLRKYMPITWITSLIGSLALIGTPFFAGFYSKESIIEAVHMSTLPAAGIAYWAALLSVFVTALYSFRMYFLVFHGPERYDLNPEAHHGHDAHAHGHSSKPHESPWVVTLPLILLAIPSVVVGYVAIQPLLFGHFFDGIAQINLHQHPVMEHLGEEFHGAWAMGIHAVTTIPFWLTVAGVGVAYYLYILDNAMAARLKTLFSPFVTILENKYYLDWINENIIARGARLLGTGFWKVGDQTLIDGLVVNGSWKVVGGIAAVVRKLQTGYVYHYALLMIMGVLALMTWFVWLGK